jgi:hypothetical protein
MGWTREASLAAEIASFKAAVGRQRDGAVLGFIAVEPCPSPSCPGEENGLERKITLGIFSAWQDSNFI